MSSSANPSSAGDLNGRDLYNRLVELSEDGDQPEIREMIELILNHPNLRIHREDADDVIEMFYELCQKIRMDSQDIWIRSIVRDGAGRFEPGIVNEKGEDNRLDLKSRQGYMEFGNMKLEHGRQAFRSLFVGASAMAVGESTNKRGPETLYPIPVDQSSIDAWTACQNRAAERGIVGHDTKVIVEGLGIDLVNPKANKARADKAKYPIWRLKMDDGKLNKMTRADFSDYEAACTHCLDAGQAHLCEDRRRWMNELREEYGFEFSNDPSLQNFLTKEANRGKKGGQSKK